MKEAQSPQNKTPEQDAQELKALLLQNRRMNAWDLGFRIVKYSIVLVVVLSVFTGVFSSEEILHVYDADTRISRDQPANVEKHKQFGHIAKVRIDGVIGPYEEHSSDSIRKSLRTAYGDPDTKALLLEIDSPGGSPVHAGEVYDELVRLREAYPEIPVVSLIRDVGASGAYYIAAASELIYANRASLVGSIGVIASGFGFKELIQKVGVERRVYTAGKNKGFLDPFLDEDREQSEAWQKVLDNVYQQFTNRIRETRGQLIKDERAYSGLLWSGEQALELGMIDHLGDINAIMDKLDIGIAIDFTYEESFLDFALSSFSASIINILSREGLPLLLNKTP